jgi:hypothetical protein
MSEAWERVRSAALVCAGTPVQSLSDADVTAALDTVHAAEQALAAAKLHLVRQIELRRLPAQQHVTSCAAWLRGRLRVSGHTAGRLVQAARALDRRPGLDQAMSAGAINVEHALVVDSCAGDVPSEAGVQAAEKAEALLIDWAADFDPQALRRLGARILAHVAPEIAERADAAALARQDAAAHAARTLSLVPDGHGRMRLTGWLDAEAGAVVAAALDPFCAPRAAAAGSATGAAHPPAPDERTAGQRRADALADVCRLALATGELPVNGGDRPQLTVTIAYDPLRRRLSAGTLESGERLAPAQVRRLACDAQLLPAVLGGEGQILDLGMSRRLISGSLRRALVLRDQGCSFPACDRPARWCEGHHIVAWSDGGPTSLDNSVLLCGPHHRLLHHSDWQVRLGHDKRPEFLPPPYVDPRRRPRRNLLHDRR